MQDTHLILDADDLQEDSSQSLLVSGLENLIDEMPSLSVFDTSTRRKYVLKQP